MWLQSSIMKIFDLSFFRFRLLIIVFLVLLLERTCVAAAPYHRSRIPKPKYTQRRKPNYPRNDGRRRQRDEHVVHGEALPDPTSQGAAKVSQHSLSSPLDQHGEEVYDHIGYLFARKNILNIPYFCVFDSGFNGNRYDLTHYFSRHFCVFVFVLVLEFWRTYSIDSTSL